MPDEKGVESSEDEASAKEPGVVATVVAELSSFHTLALVVGAVTLVVCVVVYGVAQNRSPSPLGATGASVYVKGQLAALVGVLSSIVLTKKPKAPLTTFIGALILLPIGAVFPWVHQLWPGAADQQGWIMARDYLAPAGFGFGVAMLVKAADAAKSRAKAKGRKK